MGVARKYQVAPVCGRQMHVDHLHRFESVEDGAGRQPGSVALGFLFEGDVQAVRQKTYEDVRLDTFVFLVIDRANAQVLFDLFECLFDFSQYDVLFPKVLKTHNSQSHGKSS